MLSRRNSALHRHRWSQPDAIYFVTCCTRFRVIGLANVVVAAAVQDAVSTLDAGGDTISQAFTVMPDHVHWLFTLGSRLSLGRLVARFKAQTKNALQLKGLGWQRDFFEHRLRAEEPIEPYGLYVFLNPYRAGLLPAGAVWPHWWCPRPELFRFVADLNSGGMPPAEWIDAPAPEGLAIGE